MKLLKGLFTIVLLVLLGAFVLSQYHMYQQQLQEDEEIAMLSRDAVLQKIQSMNQLETISFNIDTVITNEREGNWFKLWQDQHKSLFIARGRVQAGIDLNKLTPEHISTDDLGRSTLVTLPEVEIFRVYLEDIELYDSQIGLLSDAIEKDILHDIQIRAKSDMLNKACNSDILTLANDAAEKQIQALFMMANTSVKVAKSAVPDCDSQLIEYRANN